MSIYFLKAGDFVAYKIGFTSGDPIKRMADLQVGCPFKLEMFGCVEGTFEEEQALHKLLAPFKMTGEWFEPHTIVTDVIKRTIEKGVHVTLRKKPKRQNRACEIIDLLGGNIAVATLVEATPKAVSNWRRFGQFPSNTFIALRNALAEREIEADPILWAMVGISPSHAPAATASPASHHTTAHTRPAQQEGFQS